MKRTHEAAFAKNVKKSNSKYNLGKKFEKTFSTNLDKTIYKLNNIIKTIMKISP